MNNKIVYTSGTFDLLHVDHLKIIQYARALGNVVIVGVNTDEFARSLGKSPIVPFEERIAVIQALKGVDIVIPQVSFEFEQIFDDMNIDTFVVGSDYRKRFDYLKKIGRRVFYFPYGCKTSSSDIKKRIACK